MIKDLEKFESVFSSMEESSIMSVLRLEELKSSVDVATEMQMIGFSDMISQLSDIKEILRSQTGITLDILKVDTDTLAAENESRTDEKRKSKFEGLQEKPVSNSGFSQLTGILSEFSKTMSGIISNFSLPSGFDIAKAVILAASVPAFVQGFFTELLDGFTTEETANGIGSAIGTGTLGFIIGRLIGGRLGGIFGIAAGAGASLLGPKIQEIFGLDDEDGIFNAMGMEIDGELFSKLVGGTLAGSVVLLAPKLLGLTSTLLMGALTGPLGLAVLAGAALVGTVALVNNWLEQRKDAFIEELEEKTKEGFASIEDVAAEEDINFGRRVLLSMGLATPSNQTEELDVLRRTVSGAAEVSGDPLAEFGDGGFMQVLDPERRESLRRSVNTAIGDPSNLSQLSDRNLDDIKSIASMLDMDDLLKLIEAAEYAKEAGDIIPDQREFDYDAFDNQLLSQPQTNTAVEIPISDLIADSVIQSLRTDFVATAAEEFGISRAASQSTIMNMMPQVVNSRPVSNISNTTVVNNISPARSLDDAALPR